MRKHYRDGAINFAKMKYLPTYIFDIRWDEEQYIDDDIRELYEEDYYEMKDEIENYNYDFRDIVRRKFNDYWEEESMESDQDYNLIFMEDDLLLEIKSGYNDGYEIICHDKSFDYLNSDVLREYLIESHTNFLDKLKKEYRLTELTKTGWVSSYKNDSFRRMKKR